ncbi:MAG: sugar phosphate isomerase/epimerase, partial [Lachnospiraceae bacterium]|nr:sugar phosphate isomerase/epimerase [Lachnospiraceae bacterium]
DFRKFINVLGKRIKVLHIHDNDGTADLHQLPFTFTKTRENEPSTDWEGFINGLRDIDFDGVLSFETAPVLSSFPDEMRSDALRLIAATGRYFKSRIEDDR